MTPKPNGVPTRSRKVAVSIPDQVFADAERLARRLKSSRSRLYSLALAEFVARHSPEEIAASIDRLMDRLGEEDTRFVDEAARRILENTEW